jgi:hypothetical protein
MKINFFGITETGKYLTFEQRRALGIKGWMGNITVIKGREVLQIMDSSDALTCIRESEVEE